MAATVKGTTLMISFGSTSYTGYIAQDLSLSFVDGNVQEVLDADGAMETKIYMNPAQTIKGTFIIIGASGSITPPAPGASVGLIPPQGTLTTYCVVSAETKFVAGAAQLTLDLIKETSMSYS